MDSEQIRKVIERNRRFREKKTESLQGYRVYPTGGNSVTLKAGGSGVDRGMGLYATRANDSGIKTMVKVPEQYYSVFSPDGVSPTLMCADGHTHQVATRARAVMSPQFGKKTCNGRMIKDEGDPSYTLTCLDRHGVATSPADGKKGVMVIDGIEYNVRRLTPRECFRLQGFTDGLFDKAAAVCSDTRLYQQAGNAVTATVSYEIGKYILKLEEEYERDKAKAL